MVIIMRQISASNNIATLFTNHRGQDDNNHCITGSFGGFLENNSTMSFFLRLHAAFVSMYIVRSLQLMHDCILYSTNTA